MEKQASLLTNEVTRRNEDSEESLFLFLIHREAMPPATSTCNSATSDVLNAIPSHTMINVKLPNLKEALPPVLSACDSNVACDPTSPHLS